MNDNVYYNSVFHARNHLKGERNRTISKANVIELTLRWRLTVVVEVMMEVSIATEVMV